MQPDRNDPIYCVNACVLRRSERAFNAQQIFVKLILDDCANAVDESRSFADVIDKMATPMPTSANGAAEDNNGASSKTVNVDSNDKQEL